MQPLIGFDPSQVVAAHDYPAIALVIALAGMELHLPGEPVLSTAATYADATYRLSIAAVMLAPVLGAVLRDSLVFWIGGRLGFPLLRRCGRPIGVDGRRLKLGRCLFARYGGKVLLFGRFTALLRPLAALLASANGMEWRRFLLFNLASGVLWAALHGIGGYALDEAVQRAAGPVRIGLAALAVAAMADVVLFLRRREAQVAAKAERADPGALAPPAQLGAL